MWFAHVSRSAAKCVTEALPQVTFKVCVPAATVFRERLVLWRCTVVNQLDFYFNLDQKDIIVIITVK